MTAARICDRYGTFLSIHPRRVNRCMDPHCNRYYMCNCLNICLSYYSLIDACLIQKISIINGKQEEKVKSNLHCTTVEEKQFVVKS